MGREAETVRLTVAGQTVRFRWGQPHELGSAAYWVEQTRLREPSSDHRLGSSLAEETVACLLGGYGLPAEVGLAAFDSMRSEGLLRLDAPPTTLEVQALLERPLHIRSRSRPVRYRFPQQRAQRVSAALRFLADNPSPTQPTALREWLMDIPGVGPKTASWIARNWAGVDDVAIIDVHIRRAGLAAGFFLPDWKLPHHYAAFEDAFSSVAKIGGVSCAALDARIWRDLRFLGRASNLLLGNRPMTSLL